MKVTNSYLKRIIREELLREEVDCDKVSPDKKEKCLKLKASIKKLNTQQAIRQKADEMVDFGKWEKQLDQATDDLEKAFLALEKPMMSGDKVTIAKVREVIKQKRAEFRKLIMQTSQKGFMFYGTIKKLGGELSPQEEKTMQQLYQTLKQRQDAEKKIGGEREKVAKEKGISPEMLK